MADYLLIGSRDPFESNDVTRLYALAGNLVKNGSKVTLFLVQNGVLSARESGESRRMRSLPASPRRPWTLSSIKSPTAASRSGTRGGDHGRQDTYLRANGPTL